MKNIALKNITQILLNKDSQHDELLNASRSLAEFFENFSSISTKSSHYELKKDAKHTYLDSGVAISPLDAAICTNEYMRTTKYIRGVFEAINDLLLKFKDEKLHILYAGCGPYATLIIPILSFFDPLKIEVTFLDIHKSSLKSVKNILKGLELEDFASQYIEEDATKYKLLKETHLIVTETMKAAFDDEPQVAITLNLLPQLHKEGFFIPQRVVVGFEMAYYNHLMKNNMLSLVKDSKELCFVLDLDSSKLISKENLICTKKYTISENFHEKMTPQLSTTIYIYKDNILNENECSLNIPKKISFDKKLLKGDDVYFKYEISKNPKIIYSNTFKNITDNFKGWIPQRVIYRNDEEKIIWYKMDNKRFVKPFFDDAFSLGEAKKYSTWDQITELAKDVESIYPTGFIFHTSRCGSTILSQALAEFEENIVLSEAQLIHEALCIDYHKDISEEEKISLLKNVIKIIGQKRFENEKNLFIKFDAWSVAEIALILKAYPDVPWVFLYRDPVEVLVSQKRKRGLFTVPEQINGKIFDLIPTNTHFNDYHKEVISKIFQTALKHENMLNGIFINYRDLKNLLIDQLFPFLNLKLSDKDIQKVHKRMELDAKNPKDAFKDDSKSKNDEADDDIKDFCKKHILKNYEKLQSISELEHV